MQFACAHRIPGILEVNSPLIHEQKTYRTLVDEATAKSIRGTCFRHASSIIAVSKQVADEVRKIYFAREKTTTIANGVNCDRFQASASRTECDSEELTIGFLGTLKPWHGVSMLVDAFASVRGQIPNVRLKIVGDGPERGKLETRIERFSRDVQQSVFWVGAIPNHEVPDVLSTFDIAVAPYPDLQDFYFSPLKILEYMAAGLPVVASRIGQIPSLIEHDVTGFLVKTGCEQELASSLLRLSRDRGSRMRLGEAARNCVQTGHSWRNVVDRILATIPSQSIHCEAS